jgi:integrase
MVDKTKKPKKEIVSLTAQELKTLYQHKFKRGTTFDHVRDLFCFGCYTGQRWGDISNFNKEDLNGDVWTFISEKTLDEISIDLVGYSAPALDILKKYEYELPRISQQKFNDNIKLAAKEAGVNTITTINRYVGNKKIEIKKPKYEFLSSHAARRTCVSLLLNVYNMPITAVMGITGHSDIKTLQVYIDEDRAARREQMSRTRPVTEPLTLKKNAAV